MVSNRSLSEKLSHSLYVFCYLDYQIDQLKKKQREESDKFDAEMESIYDEATKAKVYYTSANLPAEINMTKEAQRRVISEIQLVQQQTEVAVAKLQLKDNGKNSNFLTWIKSIIVWRWCKWRAPKYSNIAEIAKWYGGSATVLIKSALITLLKPSY